MRKLKNYRFCRFSAVLAMVPLSLVTYAVGGLWVAGVSAVSAMFSLGFGFPLLGLLFGIWALGLLFGTWALAVLRRADVRAAFAQST